MQAALFLALTQANWLQEHQQSAIEEQLCGLEDAVGCLSGVEHIMLAQGSLWTAIEARLPESNQVSFPFKSADSLAL